MGNSKKPTRPDLAICDHDHDPDAGLWVRTELTDDGNSYVVTVSMSADVAFALTSDAAASYADVFLDAAARAEYDAMVLHQMDAIAGADGTGPVIVACLREDRRPLNNAATTPMVLQPACTHEAKPFIALHLNGAAVGQISPDQARTHALTVLEAHRVADLDSNYYRSLVTSLGLDAATARRVVDGARHSRVTP